MGRLLLAGEGLSRGVIGTMNLAMAVHTAFVERENVVPRNREMAHYHVKVTLLAQHRDPLLQQLRLVRPVRVVTRDAVLAHRRVLPQERAAFVGVAGVTQLVRRDGLEHGPAFASVRIEARAAVHLDIPMLSSE